MCASLTARAHTTNPETEARDCEYSQNYLPAQKPKVVLRAGFEPAISDLGDPFPRHRATKGISDTTGLRD